MAYWNVDEDEITLALAGAGMWVGFGMNEKTPSMQGADIVICREHQPGVVSAADYYAPRLGTPELDSGQDWFTVRGGREVFSPPPEPSGACPSGWTWGNYVMPNKCYKIGNAKQNYASARQSCEAEGGALAEIGNTAENEFVLDLAMQGNLSRTDETWASVWVGVKRADPSSPWTTLSGATPAYTNFFSYITSGAKDNCAILAIEAGHPGWWSGHCLWREPRAACQRAVEAGTSMLDQSLYEPLLPVTWCEIKRARRTCDRTEDYQLRDVAIALTGLLAWAPAAQVDDLVRYHGAGNRRQQLFSFCGELAPEADFPADAQTVAFEPPPHTVSTSGGSFAYSYHKFDIDEDKKYHVIQWWVEMNRNSPAGQAGLQHHVDLRSCDGGVPGAKVGTTISAAKAMEHCQVVFLSSSSTLPGDEGIVIGSGGPVYLAIERHYYNPTGKAGLQDYGSKFHVTYTAQLRPREMSRLQIGTTQLKVPPHSNGYVVRSHCPAGCTEKMGSVLAKRISFHAHGHTQAASLRHVRNGNELEPIAHIEPYEGDAFASRNVNVEILPGDELLLDCVYDNDQDTDLVYGDRINDEMCWATLTAVGQNSVKQCLDSPDITQNKWPTYDEDCAWCVSNNVFDGSCWQCNVADPFVRCPDTGAGEDMGTGRVNDMASRRGNPNIGNDFAALKYQPFVPPVQGCDTTNQQETVPAIPGACPAQAGQIITGAKDCAFKWGGSMSISWETDCSQQVVTFTMEKYGTKGWFGIGLHDAGTADAFTAMPSTRMNGADIVQVSPSTGAFKESQGVDYMTPAAKTTAAATLNATTVQNGRMTATFTRPFVATQGTTLEADRFIWLICAYRSFSDDLDGKHDQATALSKTRISLFGGVAESSRSVVSKVSAGNSSTTASGDTSAPSALIGLCAATRKSARGSASGGQSSLPAQFVISSIALMLLIAVSDASA